MVLISFLSLILYILPEFPILVSKSIKLYTLLHSSFFYRFKLNFQNRLAQISMINTESKFDKVGCLSTMKIEQKFLKIEKSLCNTFTWTLFTFCLWHWHV